LLRTGGAIAEVVESIDEEGRIFEELSLRGCVAALDGSDVIRASGIGTSVGTGAWAFGRRGVVRVGRPELMWGARKTPRKEVSSESS